MSSEIQQVFDHAVLAKVAYFNVSNGSIGGIPNADIPTELVKYIAASPGRAH